MMDLATNNNKRFIFDLRREPPSAPDWLEKAWTGATQRRLIKLTSAVIGARQRKSDPAPGRTL